MNKVFVSYVGENRATVIRLAEVLRAFDVPVWLDRDSLRPGVRWQSAIREAIAHGDFFLACFSREYEERSRSYMNEELVLAIDELRRRTTKRAWFIPVLLNECEIPDRDIGAGETLRSLQWVNLYEDWDDGIGRILTVVAPTLEKLHTLQRQLDSESVRERIRAAEGLGAMGSQARLAIPALTALLSDPNEIVLAAAAAALGNIGGASEELIAGLLGIMRRGEYYAAKDAAKALAKLGTPAVPALIEATTYPGYGIESSAADALADVRDPAAVPDLLRAARKGSRYAIRSLGNIGPAADAAVPFLVELVENPNADWLPRSVAVEALGRISGASSMPVIVSILDDPEGLVRRAAVEAIDWSNFPGDAFSTLAKLLHDTDVIVRMYAAKALGELGDVRAVPLLIGALNDDRNAFEAAIALGHLKDEAAVPTLVQLLAHDDRWVRDSASKALLEIGSEEAIRAVKAASSP